MAEPTEMVRLHGHSRYILDVKAETLTRSRSIGVYLAKDATVSMGTYAQGAQHTWKRSQSCPSNCVALAEIVNLPSRFVSSNPYFVVADTTWIMW